MKKNKNVLVGLMSALLLIITIHIALFVKYSKENVILYNSEVAPTNQSVESLQPIILIPIRPISGAT
jgi:hypothetical protein